MSIRVYSSYEEFSETERESYLILSVPEFEEIEGYDLWETDSDDSYDYDEDYTKLSSAIREDASFYVICDNDDLDLAEEISSSLGKYSKINLDEIHKTFFSIV